MYVVIFRAKIRSLDAEYSSTAKRMRELALQEFGCLEFIALTEGDEEVALSYWPNTDAITAWKNHPEHRDAQQRGRERWYASYSVQVAEIEREYRSAP